MVAEFLAEHFLVKEESKFEWCININGNICRFDIEVMEKSCLIEVDGPQHFVDMPAWHSEATIVMANDVFKMKAALQNNMRVVRICQEDVWNKVFDWKPLLLQAMNSSDSTCYIANDSTLYSAHKSMLILKSANVVNIPQETS
jgi:hypothetical protein